MSINFPTSLDTLSNPAPTDLVENTDPLLDHDRQHSDANDAIEALEAKVGINSSAVTTSHDYKLGEVTSSDKAVGKTATQTMTNKTLTDSTNNIMAKSLKSASTTIDVSAATAPSAGQVLTATDTTHATWQTPTVEVPPGVVSAYAAASAPTGYLLCDGTSYLRTDYAALFAIISTTYGSADGTHFNVPNLKGRVLVGFNSAETEFDTLGETGGEKTHTLSAAELPATTLDIARAGNNTAGSGTFVVLSTADGGEVKTLNSGSKITGASGTAHNNIQPYITLQYIIKT